MNYNGTVQRIFSTPVRGKMLHSFTLRDVKGFFNLGQQVPAFKEGNSISFDASPASRQGNFDVEYSTIVVNQDAPVQAADYQVSNMSGARRTQVLQKDDYWRNREDRDIEVQKRIEIQAARNAAIEFLKLCELEDRSLGTVEDLLGEWTDKFLENNSVRLTA